MARPGPSSAALAFAALLGGTAGVSAFVQALDSQTLAEAISIGQGRINDVRARFHAPQSMDVGHAPVDYIEIVTPFRRIALDAEARAHSGDRLYGQRDALATLGDAPSRVDIVVELTFHPLNTFIGVPDYVVNLKTAPEAPPLLPSQISRIPRFGPRLSGTPLPYPYTVARPRGTEASRCLAEPSWPRSTASRSTRRAPYWVVVSEAGKDGKELARARVDFGKLR